MGPFQDRLEFSLLLLYNVGEIWSLNVLNLSDAIHGQALSIVAVRKIYHKLPGFVRGDETRGEPRHRLFPPLVCKPASSTAHLDR
jgi:hypothetical protein